MATSKAVAAAVFRDISSAPSVSDDQLSILHFLYGKNFERATRIVDQAGVKKLSAKQSGRALFQVVGESKRGEEYICFPDHLCTCYSFFFDTVNRGEQLCCKHQLAAKLAEAVGAFKEINISDEQLAVLLSKL
ncbi:hypothetical protein AMTRI_Chr04g182190 [Amborella trichopoda]